MRIIILGDIHGRNCWSDIVKNETYDKVIFLGDYVSTHERISEEEQCSNLEDILNFKEQNPDKVVLLRGNHDMQHLGYKWAECSGYFPSVGEWMSKKDVKDRFLKDTQWVYILDNVVFSHAGISNEWLKIIGISSLEEINSLEPSEKFGFLPNNAFDYSGTSSSQPCTWIRPQTLLANANPNYIQVVGHTPMSKIINNGNVWFCDVLPFQYLIFEDNKFEVKNIGTEKIRLPNRYGYLLYLEKLKDNEYKLGGDRDALEYIGVTYEDAVHSSILSVDPSGGPFISVETLLTPNEKIKHIEDTKEGIIITTEKYEQGNKD